MTFKLPAFDGSDFIGAKIAVLRGQDVLTLLRDDIPTIPFPGEWDLPGGGREGAETPFQTAARELFEELSIRISPDKVIYHKERESLTRPDLRSHFFVARWDDLGDGAIRLGDEGQRWSWMDARDFTQRADAVKPLRRRFAQALDELGL